MSVITEILDRLSGVEIVKERLRETGARLEQWTTHAVALDRQVQDIDRRLVRIETLAELPQAARSALDAADIIARDVGAGPDSELGMALARIRNLLVHPRVGAVEN